MWVDPLLAERILKGSFSTMYTEVFHDFRMSIKSFDELLSKLENGIKVSNSGRPSISPTEPKPFYLTDDPRVRLVPDAPTKKREQIIYAWLCNVP